MRSLVLPLIGMTLVLADEAQAKAVMGPALDACLAQPTATCLLDLAAAEREVFRRSSLEEEAFNRESWLVRMATTEQAAGRLKQASTYFAQLPPAQLHELVIDIDGNFLPLPAGLDERGAIAQALETAAATQPFPDQRLSWAFDRRAEAGWLLLAFGHRGKAEAALRSVMQDISAELGSGNKEALGAASTIAQALIALGDASLVEEFVKVITATKLGSGDEDDWLREERQRAFRALRLAHIRKQMAIDPAGISPEPGDDDYVMGRIALAWTLAGRVDRVAELLKSAPMPEQELWSLVSELIERDQPDTALQLINRSSVKADSLSILSPVSEYLIGKGRVQEGEALLDRMIDPRERAETMIAMARRRAKDGRAEQARSLLGQAMAIVDRDKELNLRLLLGLEAASAYASLGDNDVAKKLVDVRVAALRKSRKDTEPLDEFAIAGKAAAVLAELGEGPKALAPIDMVVGPKAEADRVLGALLAARAMADHGRGDAARQLALEALRSGVSRPSIDSENWSGLFQLYAAFWLSLDKSAVAAGPV